jgi:hypothetical protein
MMVPLEGYALLRTCDLNIALYRDLRSADLHARACSWYPRAKLYPLSCHNGGYTSLKNCLLSHALQSSFPCKRESRKTRMGARFRGHDGKNV